VDELNARQRARLRSLAHPLKPVVHVGKDGVDQAVAGSVADAFQNRELIKVKVLETSPDDPAEAAEQLAGRVKDAHVVQVIGRTVVLYRPHPENPEIRLG